MIKAFVIVLFTIANIALAQGDAERIKKGGWIYHGINGLVYSAMATVPYYFFADYWLIGALLFNRLLVFNIALNYFRHLPWDYVSKTPKAVTDRIAMLIFGGNGMFMYLVYLLIFIGLILKVYL